MEAKTKEQAEQLARDFAHNASTMDELNGLIKTIMKSGIETMLYSEMDKADQVLEADAEALRHFVRGPTATEPPIPMRLNQ